MRPNSLALAAGLAALAAASAPLAQAAPQAATEIGGPDGPWDYASVAASPHRLYVGRGYGVMAVDLDTGAVTGKLVPGQRVHSVLPIPGGDLVLSTNGDANTATLFHARDGKVTATIPTGKKPDGALFIPQSGLVAVMDGTSSDIALIDPSKAKVVATIPVGGKLEAAAIDGEGSLFVNVEDRDELVKIDLKARKVSARFKLQGCKEPTGLAYSPHARLLVTACSNGFAKVLKTDGREVAMLKTGEDADAIIYDAARDRAFVPSPADGGKLFVIAMSGGAPRVTGQYPTRTGARTGAYDPRTGRVYLPVAKAMVKSPDGGREMPAPGGFIVQVVQVH